MSAKTTVKACREHLIEYAPVLAHGEALERVTRKECEFRDRITGYHYPTFEARASLETGA